MIGTIGKIAIATAGASGLFLAAHKLQALPAYFEAPPTSPVTGDANLMRMVQQDKTAQRVNSFAAGIAAGGIATILVLAFWGEGS